MMECFFLLFFVDPAGRGMLHRSDSSDVLAAVLFLSYMFVKTEYAGLSEKKMGSSYDSFHIPKDIDSLKAALYFSPEQMTRRISYPFHQGQGEARVLPRKLTTQGSSPPCTLDSALTLTQ